MIEQGDSVVALVHITARGKASGVEVDVRFYAQFKVRDDKVVYIYDHGDRAAALEAAGLRDSSASLRNRAAVLDWGRMATTRQDGAPSSAGVTPYS
jgi:hypothetical protein